LAEEICGEMYGRTVKQREREREKRQMDGWIYRWMDR
jgi:hypothetical protein